MQLGEITAAVLAGGLGTRLRSQVSDRPKVLASVGGRPFLSYLLEHLAGSGLRRVVLCVGYMAEQVRATFGNEYLGMQIAYSEETAPLGTGGALRLALGQLESDPSLVLNGDSFCRAPLADFLAFYRWHDARAALLLTRVPDARRFGRVAIAPDDRVVRFEEKNNAAGPAWINAGVYLISRERLESIPPATSVSLERDVFPYRLDDGLYGYRADAPFLDIGTPESYAEAAEFLARD